MSKKGGKVVPIIMVLVILVIVLATSTYAWFTTNQEIENTGINIQARASQKMQISVDAKTWKNAITLQDILKASYDVERLNQVPDNFQAYSSIGSLQNGKIEMFHGFVSQDRDTSSESFGKKTLTAEKVVETDGVTGGFLTFDLYLNNDLGSNIYLGRNSYVKYSGEDVASGIENT